MVTAESLLCQHLVDKIPCSVRFKVTCKRSTAMLNGRPVVILRYERGGMGQIRPNVHIVPHLRERYLSVRALHKIGIQFDRFSITPVLRKNKDTLRI